MEQKNNGNYKKGNLLDSVGQFSCSRRFGLCHIMEIEVQKFYIAGEWVNFSNVYYKNVYYKQPGVFVNIQYNRPFLKIDRLFDYEYALKKELSNTNNRGGYGYNNYGYYNRPLPQELNENEITTVKIEKIMLRVKRNHNRNRISPQIGDSIEVDKSSLENLLNETFWLLGDLTSLSEPLIANINVGDEYLYKKEECLCEVIKVYDYPNKDGLYEIKRLDNEEIVTIKTSGEIFNLSICGNEFEIFNEHKNELALQPFVSQQGCTYNVYWQEIKEAANYVVSVYKQKKLPNKKNLYLLKEQVIDRNEKIAIFKDLIDNDFIFVVKAESREGTILAQSRGIILGEPKWW